jgi:hypothetical protein
MKFDCRPAGGDRPAPGRGLPSHHDLLFTLISLRPNGDDNGRDIELSLLATSMQRAGLRQRFRVPVRLSVR